MQPIIDLLENELHVARTTICIRSLHSSEKKSHVSAQQLIQRSCLARATYPEQANRYRSSRCQRFEYFVAYQRGVQVMHQQVRLSGTRVLLQSRSCDLAFVDIVVANLVGLKTVESR